MGNLYFRYAAKAKFAKPWLTEFPFRNIFQLLLKNVLDRINMQERLVVGNTEHRLSEAWQERAENRKRPSPFDLEAGHVSFEGQRQREADLGKEPACLSSTA